MVETNAVERARRPALPLRVRVLMSHSPRGTRLPGFIGRV